MRDLPVIFDEIPSYLPQDGRGGSLLTMPAAGGTLLGEIIDAIGQVTTHRPLIVPLFTPSADYQHRLEAATGRVLRMADFSVLHDPLAHFEASESLLLVSPRCYPSGGLDLEPIVRVRRGSVRMTRHLLAFEASSLGTKEIVHVGSRSGVRRIQRYFAPVTWPFPVGLIASLVPVSALLMSPMLAVDSLERLRAAMSAQGMSSQDVPYHGEFFDLGDEAGALTFIERRLLAAVRAEVVPGIPADEEAREAVLAGLRHPSARVHPSAQLVGPVFVGEGGIVEEGATVIGPAVIGEGAVVSRDAVIAQCFVTPQSVIGPEEVLRHCVVADHPPGAPRPSGQRRFISTVPEANPSEPWASSARHLQIKAMLDAVLAMVAIVLFAPVLIVVAILVKATSPGPIFYGAPREGLHGRPFRCWKFRSMQTNADALQKQLADQQQMDGPQFKMTRDPRVTPLGRVLRSTNLDELPQLFNVAAGQMALVGPRPSPFGENQICVPWRNARLSVRPGITGLWQICRRDRDEGDFHQWIQYDLLYVRNTSLLLDLKILGATIWTGGGRTPVPIERLLSSEVRPVAFVRRHPVHAEPLAPLRGELEPPMPVVATSS